MTRDPRYLTTSGSTRSELVVPIRSQRSGNIVGTIDVESERLDAFSIDDQALLESCARALGTLYRYIRSPPEATTTSPLTKSDSGTQKR